MDLSISVLREAYATGRLKPTDVMEHILGRLDDEDQRSVWISTADHQQARLRAAYLDTLVGTSDSLPLYGMPFSVKDNIDVDGEETTAACPEFSYKASRSATVIEAALRAGAMFIGKTNLDQFATGLVGVRSPYGTPLNPFNNRYIPGGSSAGAGVSVSTGMVSFAFGTDTGGSGRVPASYNGIVGLKPAPGWLSRRGLVFACRSIDTATLFTNSADDAYHVFDSVCGYDSEDPYCLDDTTKCATDRHLEQPRFGIPQEDQLKYFGNKETPTLFDQAVVHLGQLRSIPKTVDFELLTDINDLMFFGPLLAERDVSVGMFVDAHPEACDGVVQSLITGSRKFSAAEAYSAIYKIADAKAAMRPLWQDIDVLMVPTVGSVYTLEDISNEPLQHNFNNGYYTNFANPLGLSAVATPFGKTADGVPWGVTFLFKPGVEREVCRFADEFSAHWRNR